MEQYQNARRTSRTQRALLSITVAAGFGLFMTASLPSDAAETGAKHASASHAIEKSAVHLAADTGAIQKSRPSIYQDQMDNTYDQLNDNAANIRKLIDELNTLTDMTPEKAKEAAEGVIGIATDIEKLFSEGSEIDKTVAAAREYFRTTGTDIADLLITAAQKEHLLSQLRDHKRDFNTQISNLEEMRNELQVLTAQAQQSREFFAGMIMVETAEGIVEHVAEMTATMSQMAENLRTAVAKAGATGA